MPSMTQSKYKRKKPFWKKSFYCGAGNDCYPKPCRVCKYLDFREWAEGCAPPGSTIERDELVETFIKTILPLYEK
jgi:hypothetical protein